MRRTLGRGWGALPHLVLLLLINFAAGSSPSERFTTTACLGGSECTQLTPSFLSMFLPLGAEAENSAVRALLFCSSFLFAPGAPFG